MHITEFEEFFKKAGVKYTKMDLKDIDPTETLSFYPEGTKLLLSITTCSFLFTEVGNFIGTYADEMSYYEPKLEVKS